MDNVIGKLRGTLTRASIPSGALADELLYLSRLLLDGALIQMTDLISRTTSLALTHVSGE